MRAREVAQSLHGTRLPSGGFLCRCPVSNHGKRLGDRHPSLSIADGDKHLLVMCFAGCDRRDILDALQHRGLHGGEVGDRRDAAPAQRPRPPPDARALELWQAASAAPGTAVERHLRDFRGITVDIPPSIRCGPGPSLVAAVQNPAGRVIAVQTMRLTPSGEKAAVQFPRRTIGALGSGAVRLGRAGRLLGLAEGTEKALAAKQLTGIEAVWSSLGAHRMHRVAIPERVRELHVFADADEPGRAAARRTADEHRHLRVVLHFPPPGCKDWDEVTQSYARQRS